MKVFYFQIDREYKWRNLSNDTTRQLMYSLLHTSSDINNMSAS